MKTSVGAAMKPNHAVILALRHDYAAALVGDPCSSEQQVSVNVAQGAFTNPRSARDDETIHGPTIPYKLTSRKIMLVNLPPDFVVAALYKENF